MRATVKITYDVEICFTGALLTTEALRDSVDEFSRICIHYSQFFNAAFVSALPVLSLIRVMQVPTKIIIEMGLYEVEENTWRTPSSSSI